MPFYFFHSLHFTPALKEKKNGKKLREMREKPVTATPRQMTGWMLRVLVAATNKLI